MKTTNCERCDTEIYQTGRKKYCIECAKIVNREQARARDAKTRAARPAEMCSACGKEFTSDTRWKYCSDECAVGAQRSLSAEYKRLHRQEVPPPPTSLKRHREVKLQQKAPLTLTELSAAAEAAGMSYGKYVALMKEGKLYEGKPQSNGISKAEYRQAVDNYITKGKNYDIS